MPESEWRPIRTAPKDGRPVLLLTKSYGVVEAWFSQGEWEDHHEYGRLYSGPMWVCADDQFQIEVEETPDGHLHGGATHWMPLPPPPLT